MNSLSPPQEPLPPPQPIGCTLVMRDGRRIEVDGLSVSRAKHLRRSSGSITVSKDARSKLQIEGDQIKHIIQVLPHFW